jgi:hypothetical protein
MGDALEVDGRFKVEFTTRTALGGSEELKKRPPVWTERFIPTSGRLAAQL